LRAEVGRVRAGLARLGVGRADRVAAYVPNIPEALIAFLATASLGAIWSACSPAFGASSVADRFAQIEPKALIAVDGYRYAGKPYDRSAVVREIAAQLPSLQAVVWVPLLGGDGATPAADGGVRALSCAELRSEEAGLEFERVPFGHPLRVLYSSRPAARPTPTADGHGALVLE